MSGAWLMLTAGERRTHHGNDGYDDVPDSHYSWDSTVPNHGKPQVGDLIVIWNKQGLVGFSRIDQIYFEESVPKLRKRCPSCNATKIHLRVNREPRFNCRECGLEFAEPARETIEVDTYRTEHAAQWTVPTDPIAASELRDCCLSPKSQHSIRMLDEEKFFQAIGQRARNQFRTNALRQQGHRLQQVSVRIGQSSFRRHLLTLYGSTCAVTGEQPQEVLEAAHLYSYAEEGVHHSHGGLLLRRDIHRLFDLGMLSVDADHGRVLLTRDLSTSQTYSILNGEELKVSLNEDQRAWLRMHADQYRFG